MNKDSFDKALKNKLPDAATDFDLDAAWTALEARRRKQPGRRVFAWWLLAGFVLLAGGGTAWWWAAQHATERLSVQTQQQPSTNALPRENQLVALPDLAADRHAETTPGNGAGVGDRHTVGDRKGRPYGTSRVEGAQPLADNYHDVGDHKTPDIPNAQSSVGATLAVAHHDAGDQHDAGDREGRPYGASRVDGLFGKMVCLPITQPGLLQRPRPEFSFERFAQMPPAEKRRRRQAPKWSVGAQAVFGINRVSRTGAPDYVTARNQEEETLDMFQVGLDIRRQLNRHVFFQTGIQYSQWIDVRRSAHTTESTRPDSNLLLERILYPDGSVENVYGPGEVTVLTTTTETRYNRYRHIEVPVIAGLALPFGSHWQLEAAAGVAIGLMARQSGSATIGSETLALDALPYRNAGTLTATGSLAWMYRHSDWSAGLALMGRSGLNSSAQGNAAFSEKRKSLGLGIVVRRAIR